MLSCLKRWTLTVEEISVAPANADSVLNGNSS